MKNGQESVPESIWNGTFRLFGVGLRCHILSDGQRIIEHDSVLALLAAMSSGETEADMEDLERFARWQRGETVPEAKE